MRRPPTGTIDLIASFSATRDSTASCAGVFSLVSDLEGHRRWARDDLTVTRTDGGGFESRAVVAGRQFTARIEIESVEEPTRFVFRVTDETGVYRHTFDLLRRPTGCRVTRRVEALSLSVRQRVLFWLALLPVRRPALRVSIARLCDLAESLESI